jgi:F-type H+-transporting ATPase subunit c
MEEMVLAKAAAFISAALVMGIGSISPAYGQGLIGAKACESIGKYPESEKNIRATMIIALSLVESSAIYCFLIAIILVLFKS